MHKKILCLGCSFSAGSYIIDPNNSKKDICVDNSLSFYHLLDNNNSVDIHSFAGGGYSFYANFMYLLDSLGELSKYDYVVIQETSEPRSVFGNDIYIKRAILSNYTSLKRTNIDRKINLIKWNLAKSVFNEICMNLRWVVVDREETKISKEKLQGSYFSLPHDWLTEISAIKIDNLLKKKNIPGYIWSWNTEWSKFENPTYLKRINLKENIMKELKKDKKRLWAVHHQTLEGNNVVAQILNKANLFDR
jgi:hypothetical protein